MKGRWLHAQPNQDNREPKLSGSCPGLLLRTVSCDGTWFFIPCPTVAGTVRRYLVLQVIACLRAPTHEAKCLRLCEPLLSVCVGGAGQRACTVPTSATQRFIQSIAQKWVGGYPSPYPKQGTALSSQSP